MLALVLDHYTDQSPMTIHVFLSRALEDGETLKLFRDNTEVTWPISQFDELHYYWYNAVPNVTGEQTFNYMARFIGKDEQITDSADYALTFNQEFRCSNVVTLPEVLVPTPKVHQLYARSNPSSYAEVYDGSDAISNTGDLLVAVVLLVNQHSSQTTVPAVNHRFRLRVEIPNIGFDQTFGFYDYNGGIYTFRLEGVDNIWNGHLTLENQTVLMTPHYYNENTNIDVSVGETATLDVRANSLVDVPITDGLVAMWDTRFNLDMTTRQWRDIVGNSMIQFAAPTADQSATLLSHTLTRHNRDSLRLQRTSGGSAVGTFVKDQYMGHQLPPSWTIFVIGYARANWTAMSGGADNLLGYLGTDAYGPFEGYYKRSDGQFVASSANIIQPQDNFTLGKSYAITSDRSNDEVRFYLDGNFADLTTFDTSTLGDSGSDGTGWLRFLMSGSPFYQANMQLGQMLIFSRVLDEFEIGDLHSYAHSYWYDGEI